MLTLYSLLLLSYLSPSSPSPPSLPKDSFTQVEAKQVSGPAFNCPNWPSTGRWQARRALCQQYPHYRTVRGDQRDVLCRCDIQEPFRSDKKIVNSTIEGSPTLIIANRPHSLFRLLSTLLHLEGSSQSPLMVNTQNTSHSNTQQITLLLRALQVPLFYTNPPHFTYLPSLIAYQYLSGLSRALALYPHAKHVIVLEDDVIVSPDFYRFLHSTAPLLSLDSSLYCVSAHNDVSYAQTSYDTSALLRTESYPNYGWMAKRGVIASMVKLMLDYAAKEHQYDWDLLVYEFIRGDRECIIPEVSRSKHIGGDVSVHHNNSIIGELFSNKNYNTDPTASVSNVNSLLQSTYESHLHKMLSRADYLDAKQTNPCMPNFWNITDHPNKVYVLFFHLPHRKMFNINKDYKQLLQCLGVFYLHPREGHKGLYRMRLGSSHLLLIGYPQSVYSSYRPPHLPMFYYSEARTGTYLPLRSVAANSKV